MSKNRPEVKEVTCKDCDFVYNSVEYTECPICANRREADNLFNEIFDEEDE